MNAEALLEHYEKIADAPGAVAQLRHFILNLAVRGKLVPQDAEDEPASKLLDRIRNEIPSPKVRSGEVEVLPYDVPKGWVWTRLGGLVAHSDAGWSPKTEDFPRTGDEWGVLKVSAVSWDKFRAWENKQILRGTEARLQAQVKCGDFLISRANTAELIARAVIVDEEPIKLMMSDKIVRLCLSKSCNDRFVLIVNNYASFARAHYVEGASGVSPSMKNVSRDVILDLPFPLPPLAEQHRIIAKVDELMSLCDRLEAARAGRERVRDRLAAASLARLNAPDPETFDTDARFALDALSALTSRSDQIKALRQTILNLGARGKLVPQDATDEPASELLKRIAKERHKLLQAGYPNPDEARTQIKKLAEQIVPDGLETLPTGWAWATLLQCSALVIDCKNKTAPYANSGIRLIRTTNVRDGRMNLNDQKYVDQKTYEIWSARCTPEPGDILITREAPMGEVCLIPPGERICLGQRMMLARLVPDTIDRNFMIYSLRDPKLMDRVQDKPIGATVQHLRVGGVETMLVPLPPLAEQRRVVAKLDVLMALCDRLEANLSTAAATRRRLLDAILAEALAHDVKFEAAA